MQNLGTAQVQVNVISGGLPFIGREGQRFNFDINAFNWPVVKNSDEFPPVLIENIIDEPNAFAVCYLAKRRHFIDNYIQKSDGTSGATQSSENNIVWKAIKFNDQNMLDSGSILNQIIPRFNDYDLIQPDNYTNDPNYNGPEWVDASLTRKIEANDCDFLRPYESILESSFGENVCETENAEETTTTEVEPLASTNYVNQTKVKDGLWWAIESSPFLAEENTPFWIQFNKMQSPTSAEHETMIVISIAPGHATDWYDILIRNDGKPSIIDYRGNLSEGVVSPEVNSSTPSDGSATPESSGETTPAPPPSPRVDFEKESSKVLDEQDSVEMGIMVIAGRLVVFVNNVPVIYTRVEKRGPNAGQIKECKIPSGKVQIFATNVQACVNISPMTFAPAGLMAWNLAHLPEGLEYQGINNEGEFEGLVVKLPKQLDGIEDVYGIDCRKFIGDGGTTFLPNLSFFQKKGLASFKKNVEDGPVSNTDTYILALKADVGNFGGANLPNSRTPFFFRLKGGAKIDVIPTFETQVLEDVQNVTETAEAPDYFHFKKTATITVYNKNGQYDYLRDSQYGITLEWGWVAEVDNVAGVVQRKKTFTGVIISATSVEVAGREALQLYCEDYMYILANTPIVNSPFYDGMIAFYAIRDLAQRAELTSDAIHNDISPTLETPFLPSGYGFTKPAMRFPSQNMILECMLNIVKRFQLFIYFDANGLLHVRKLPGGLFSDVSGETIVSRFTRNPSDEFENVILDEKNVEFNYDSTATRISVMTVDRDTRLPILITRSPESYGDSPLLLYKKVMLLDQPALGGFGEAVDWVENLAQRVFKPIRKTSFKTAGGLSNVLPFDFILVDGIEFRLMSLNRTFSAESNDFTNTYNAEWLGG